MLLDALNTVSSGPLTGLASTYFSNAGDILGTISGTVGSTGVRVVPNLVANATTDSNGAPVDYYSEKSNNKVVLCFGPCPPPKWTVSVTHAANDPFWATGAFTVYAIQGPSATNLAAHPEVNWEGETLQSLLASSPSATLATTDSTAYGGEVRSIFNPLQIAANGTYTLVIANTTTLAAPAIGTIPTTTTYALLAGDVYLNATAHYGQELAFGGTLGTWLSRQSEPNPENPSEPAYDGFDLPMHFVPPFSAQILGGNPGDSIVASYLNLATTAASNASMAVATAMQNLLNVQSGGAAIQAASQQSSLAMSQNAAALCGSSNTSCDTYPFTGSSRDRVVA
jgi:hypothetical protein